MWVDQTADWMGKLMVAAKDLSMEQSWVDLKAVKKVFE